MPLSANDIVRQVDWWVRFRRVLRYSIEIENDAAWVLSVLMRPFFWVPLTGPSVEDQHCWFSRNLQVGLDASKPF